MVGALIAAGFAMDHYQTKWHDEKIENSSFTTYGFIEKLKRTNKWTSTKHSRDAVYLYFIKNDSVFHLIDLLSEGEIEEIGMKIGYAYELKVAENDYDVFDVNYDVRRDTFVHNRHYKTQIYLTERHRRTIE